MACRPVGAKPLSKPTLAYSHLDPEEYKIETILFVKP